MQALVVYESFFGNTRDIAEAVAGGLATRLEVTLTDVADAPRSVPAGIGLLVVGGPTHAFGMTRPATRQDAARQAGLTPDPDRIGLREWLAAVGPAGRALPAAAFDTRVRKPRMPGSAAHRASAQLRRHGFTVLDDPTTFWVEGTPGPLLPDEVHRAREWGEEIASRVAHVRTTPTEDRAADVADPVDRAAPGQR